MKGGRGAIFIVRVLVACFVTVFSNGAIAGYWDNGQGNGESEALMVIAHNRSSGAEIPQDREKGPCWYVTESGYIAALEEDLLDRAIFWAGLGNAEQFEKFIESNPLIFPLRAGLRVQIDKFSFSDKVRIRPAGTTISVWTVREAIRSVVFMEGS